MMQRIVSIRSLTTNARRVKKLSHSYPTWQTLSYLQTLSSLQTLSTSSTTTLYPTPNRNLDHHVAVPAPTPLPFNEDKKLWEELFVLDLPEGHCVGLQLFTEDILTEERISSLSSFLNPDEIVYGTSLKGQPAKMTFFLGRLAIRTSLNNMSHRTGKKTDCDPVLRDEHGRPILPKDFLGSISHKGLIGVALVDLDEGEWCGKKRRGIGVDVEQSYTRRQNVGKRVLTQGERDDLGKIKGVTRDEEVLLRFSLKESLYKAMHPLLTQYVGFQEAEIYPHEDGTATVRLNLKNGAHKRFSHVTAHWRSILGDYFLTSASVTLKE